MRKRKKVVQKTRSGSVIAVFDSITEAAEKTGFSKTGIARVCRGSGFECGGYRWFYVSEITINPDDLETNLETKPFTPFDDAKCS